MDLIRLRAVDDACRGRVHARFGPSPLVFDSPHSGTVYPADFDPACDLHRLRKAEDTHVEKLFDFVDELGISWVEALFPRSYVDVNRSDADLDPSMMQDAWPDPVTPDPAALAKIRLGKGLLWRLTDEGEPIYSRKLEVAEVRARIDQCWRPYQEVLARAIAAAHAAHGYSIHVNCHSMPSVAASHATDYPGLVHPDFVLGDRDGTTADPELAQVMARFLRGCGYTVAINHPYKGVELVRRHSNLAQHRHSIQLEINRRLYMDEETLMLHPSSPRLKRHLRELALLLLAGAAGLAKRRQP